MTPEQRDLARHALGPPNKRKQSYRNHFVTGEGSEDHAPWLAMVIDGIHGHDDGTSQGFNVIVEDVAHDPE